jgi:hypothetical protein
MIFKHNYELILEGKKTQARRPARTHDFFDGDMLAMWKDVTDADSEILRYRVGDVYTVRPETPTDQTAQIRITRIRFQEDIRETGFDDMLACGYTSRYDFLRAWRDLYGDGPGPVWVIEFEVISEDSV